MTYITMERLREIERQNCHRIGEGHLIAHETTMEGWEMARELIRLREVMATLSMGCIIGEVAYTSSGSCQCDNPTKLCQSVKSCRALLDAEKGETK